MKSTRYEVAKYSPDGAYLCAVAGMGRNRGTWDSDHSRSAAYHHARTLRRLDPAHRYSVEPVNH